MLIETAVADSFGAGREYASPTIVGADFYDPSKYISHLKWHLPPGLYTDDTAMSVGVAEVLVEKGFKATKLDYANKFVEVFHRDQVLTWTDDHKRVSAPRQGYARRFYDFMLTVKSGEDMLARIKPDSDKSGGAMRSGPLGVIHDINDLLAATETHARITHDTQDGVEAAQAAALMAHYCVYNCGLKRHIGEFVQEILGNRLEWDVDYDKKVGPKGWMSVRAAITAIKNNETLEDIMLYCVRLTGDVDTAAAIAAAAASCHPGILSNYHPALYATLENGTYGRDFLALLDIKLMALADARYR